MISNIESRHAKPLSSLVHKLQKRGIKLSSVVAGGNSILAHLEDAPELDARQDTVATACGLEHCRILIKDDNENLGFLKITTTGTKRESLVDYGLLRGDKGKELMSQLDEVAEEFYKQWGR
jgi:methylmalonyl-CoA mutase cobalamin-binding subunit